MYKFYSYINKSINKIEIENCITYSTNGCASCSNGYFSFYNMFNLYICES